MPDCLAWGLTVLCVLGGAALCVLAHSAYVRVWQLGSEYRTDHEIANRHLRLKEREADLHEREIENTRRSLDLRERELALDEAEAREDDDGYTTDE